jgi:hypothetical protein
MKAKTMRISMELAEEIERIVANNNQMISKIAASRIIAQKARGKNRKKKKPEFAEYI